MAMGVCEGVAPAAWLLSIMEVGKPFCFMCITGLNCCRLKQLFFPDLRKRRLQQNERTVGQLNKAVLLCSDPIESQIELKALEASVSRSLVCLAGVCRGAGESPFKFALGLGCREDEVEARFV